MIRMAQSHRQKQPSLPEHAPPDRRGPHPLHRPDERKEGGPDFGKEDRQRRESERARREAGEQADDRN